MSEISNDWAKPIERENLSDRAYTTIRNALMRGQLKPGERLRLRPLSERFGISLTPMREALLRLVFERAMTFDERGTVVVPSLTLAQLQEIRSIRMDLEGKAAASAAAHVTPEELQTLRDIQAGIADCHARQSFADAVHLNTEFHLGLCRAGRLPITYDLVENLWVRCGPILSHLYDAGVPPNWVPHPHERILDALEAGDAEAAEAGIRFDIEMGGQGLLKHVSAGG
ncbi:MAG: GntR family transcriptional regulator [Rhodobacteraceae bacterium]|jgi:DNA-binding GntR family transcriptional regulator|uniref:Transcriptional regulator n=1 Tax=Salipiger profundus TaxID=1229727 RepID=A0A1U7DCF2_9RHOB|nr:MULTISPECIES: GntR family transcriptional regulator [Salipiger]APX25803.1 transcriptional regulator [Salipiger profundus]MAB08472.1 GntR family transcriptional regulator [Paracoccaceae bacterium]SFC85883.1 DNA-binding transcriptional regulator, GntR family [Salipiger profundus]